jgi:hypothetical protein
MCYIYHRIGAKSGFGGGVGMKGRIYDKLCEIDDSARASALSNEALYFCGQCGAEAHDPISVCEPVEFSGKK